MSNLAYTRPLGTWASNQPIRAAELADIDAKTVKAPNFAEGGSYAPSAPIYVGGAGMQVKLVGASSLVNGAALDCLSGSFLNIQPGGNFQSLAGSTSNFAGQVYISSGGNVDVFGRVTIRGGSADPHAGFFTEAGSVAQFDGSAAFSQPVNFTAGFNVSGLASLFTSTVSFTGFTRLIGNNAIAGTTTISGTVELQSPVTASGAGRVAKRPPTVIATTGANITGFGPANTDTVIVRALSAPVAIYVELGQNGEEFTVINKSGTSPLEVRDANSGAAVFSMINRSGNYRSVTLVQVAGAWEVLRTEPFVGSV